MTTDEQGARLLLALIQKVRANISGEMENTRIIIAEIGAIVTRLQIEQAKVARIGK